MIDQNINFDFGAKNTDVNTYKNIDLHHLSTEVLESQKAIVQIIKNKKKIHFDDNGFGNVRFSYTEVQKMLKEEQINLLEHIETIFGYDYLKNKQYGDEFVFIFLKKTNLVGEEIILIQGVEFR